MICCHCGDHMAERLHHDPHEQTHGRQLGRRGEESSHRRGRALVDIRRPHMERHGRNLEGQAGDDQHDADDNAHGRNTAGRLGQHRSDIDECRRAGEAIDHGGAIEQHARGQRAEDEVLHAGFGRTQIVPAEGGDHIERQALQFQAEIERDQVVRRQHQQHADGRQQHQNGKLEAAHPLALDIVHGHDDRERRTGEHQDLEEHAELVDDEETAEGGGAVGSR